MTYRKEFEDWFVNDALQDSDEYPTGGECNDAHKLLSAFARLVREEAAIQQKSEVLKGRDVYATGLAFSSICERFKLEGK